MTEPDRSAVGPPSDDCMNTRCCRCWGDQPCRNCECTPLRHRAEPDQPDTAAIRAEHTASPHKYGTDCLGCRQRDFDVPWPCLAVRLCDALDAARQFGIIASRTAGVEAERAERAEMEHQRANDNAEKLRVTRIRAEEAEAQRNRALGDLHTMTEEWRKSATELQKAEAERDTAIALGTPDPVQIASLTHAVRILTAERDKWREVAELHNAEFEEAEAKLDAVLARLREIEDFLDDPDAVGHGLFCASHYEQRPCDCWAAKLAAILDGPTQ
jgi:hypothetical protein